MSDIKPGEPGYLAQQVERALLKFLPPEEQARVIAEPSDDPNTLKAKVYMPSSWFVGKSAGELRKLGIKTLRPEVPDCAVMKRIENGNLVFEWIEVDLTLAPKPSDTKGETTTNG